MPAEATSARLVASSYTPAALLGRSLGRSVRLATRWVSVVTVSAESAITRTLKLRPTGPRAVPALLLEELAALLRAQPEGELGALAKNAKFWSLVESLYAARHLGAPGDDAANTISAASTTTGGPTQTQGAESQAKVVDAAVLPEAAPAIAAADPQPAPGGKRGARTAAAEAGAAAAVGDAPDTGAEPKPKAD
jgi:hypothetical protein